jgi:hypothetical protein
LPQRQMPSLDNSSLPQRQMPSLDNSSLPQRQMPSLDNSSLPQRQMPSLDNSSLPQRQMPSLDNSSLLQREMPSLEKSNMQQRQIVKSTDLPASRVVLPEQANQVQELRTMLSSFMQELVSFKNSAVKKSVAENVSKKAYVLVDSRKRNIGEFANCNSYSLKLPKVYKNVKAIQLVSGKIPEVNHNCLGFSFKILGENEINISVSPGTYTVDELIEELSKRIPESEICALKKDGILIRNLGDDNLDIESDIDFVFERIDKHTISFMPLNDRDSYLELHLDNIDGLAQQTDTKCVAQLYYPSEENAMHIAPLHALDKPLDVDHIDISFKNWNGELVNFYGNEHLLTFVFIQEQH